MPRGCPEEDVVSSYLSLPRSQRHRAPPCHLFVRAKGDSVFVLLRGRDDSSEQTVSRPWEGPQGSTHSSLSHTCGSRLINSGIRAFTRDALLVTVSGALAYFHIFNTRKHYEIQLDTPRRRQQLHNPLPLGFWTMSFSLNRSHWIHFYVSSQSQCRHVLLLMKGHLLNTTYVLQRWHIRGLRPVLAPATCMLSHHEVSLVSALAFQHDSKKVSSETTLCTHL